MNHANSKVDLAKRTLGAVLETIETLQAEVDRLNKLCTDQALAISRLDGANEVLNQSLNHSERRLAQSIKDCEALRLQLNVHTSAIVLAQQKSQEVLQSTDRPENRDPKYQSPPPTGDAAN